MRRRGLMRPPEKFTPEQRAKAVRLYELGESARAAGAAIGATQGSVFNMLREAGVPVRSTSESRAIYFERGGRPSVSRYDIPVDEVLARYLAGESAKSLADRFGTCHDAIRRRLKKAGARIRPIAEAAPLRNQEQMSARVAESRSRLRGWGEDVMFEWLSQRGERPERQWPVGPYNLDLALWPIAVEIETCSANPLDYARTRKRVKHMIDAGWWLCYVLISRRTWVLLPVVADEIVALAKRARSLPAVPREHRVIRGCGEVATLVGDDLHDAAFKPPAMSCPYHPSAHKGVAR